MARLPTNARHFGDLNDPESEVSQMVMQRGGYDLLPEQETKPVNKYLPPRMNKLSPQLTNQKQVDSDSEVKVEGFWKWLDDALEKI